MNLRVQVAIVIDEVDNSLEDITDLELLHFETCRVRLAQHPQCYLLCMKRSVVAMKLP